jgi:hypothetical protein
MSTWLSRGIEDSWVFERALGIILGIEAEPEQRKDLLNELRKQAEKYNRTFKDRDKVLKQITLAGG